MKKTENNMEQMLRFLYQEWECSGPVKKELLLPVEEANHKVEILMDEISLNKKIVEETKLSMSECMYYSKENFVILRIIQKIKKEHDRILNKKLEPVIMLKLDKEEYSLYKGLFLFSKEKG